ncbi:MAG: HNH endonuclease signature motif containing protein [Planctomycetota bacterium]|nr:HNH endonuclease signature motif containing protein [Planctomycetota bacterium]MDA1138009.1 HNH endonuclease signature motif containing protein [Planctomycetota bacterium]
MPEYIHRSLRELVRERANHLCEYCRLHKDDAILGHQPDHIIALKHGGQTDQTNLAWSCALCNSFKGSDISSIDPVTENLTPLFSPRLDDWNEHFRYEAGSLIPLTPIGRVSERILNFNRSDLVQLRLVLSRIGRYPNE